MTQENDPVIVKLTEMIETINQSNREKETISGIVDHFFQDIDDLANPYYTDETIKTVCEAREDLRLLVLSTKADIEEREVYDNVFSSFCRGLRDRGLAYNSERGYVQTAPGELLVTSRTPGADLERLTDWYLNKMNPQYFLQLANDLDQEVNLFRDYDRIKLVHAYRDFQDSHQGERWDMQLEMQALQHATGHIIEFSKGIETFVSKARAIQHTAVRDTENV